MKSIFDNLYLYEIVLLFLGIFLFMLLCAGLVYFILKKGDLKKLLFFFPIPIIMIAYPSIQEIQIEKDKFALRKFSNKVIENPNDSIAQKKLLKITEKLEKRATDIEDIKAVAEANLLLGNSEKVIDLTNKAIKDKDEVVKDTSQDSLALIDQQRIIDNIQTLEEIKTVATIQKAIKKDPSALKDTVKLKQQINRIHWENPKTNYFLSNKIIPFRVKTDTTKDR